MFLSSGKNVTVNVWEKGLTFQGQILSWNQKEVVINDKTSRKQWTFPYQDVINGKIKISPKKIH